MSGALRVALADRAAACYRPCGQWAWRFARGKLRGDPMYAALLDPVLLPDRARVLDLGCGKALVAAWLAAAANLFRQGDWPPALPPPPSPVGYHGIERSAADVAVASRALAGLSWLRIAGGDLRHVQLPPADVVLLLDVLHYLEPEAQYALLARVRDQISGGGRLLLRVGDAGASAGYRISAAVDRLVCLARGQPPRLHGRSLDGWRELLDDHSLPMSDGTPFANTLLLARPR